MMELIRRLERKADVERRNILMEELHSRNWNFELQSYEFAGQPGCNIILDINNLDIKEFILLVAHYDSFFLSPGANDDASALAILMDAAEMLRHRNFRRRLRVVFFDDEEPTVHWRRPVGSSMYVQEFGVHGLVAVIDLELCGMGDAIGIWPVEGIEQRPVLQQITAALQEQGIRYDFGRRIPGFYADYLPFRERGFPDAYCLTAFHWSERQKLQRFAEASPGLMLLRYFAWRFLRFPTVPKIFQHYHSKLDRSEFLSEETLRMMSGAVCEIVLRLDRLA